MSKIFFFHHPVCLYYICELNVQSPDIAAKLASVNYDNLNHQQNQQGYLPNAPIATKARRAYIFVLFAIATDINTDINSKYLL